MRRPSTFVAVVVCAFSTLPASAQTAAVRGTNSSTTGASHGVVGTTESAAGAGVVADNKALGWDLTLAGNDALDTLFLDEHSIVRYSGDFNFFATDGVMQLVVEGFPVYTAGNDGPGSGLDADTVDGEHLSDLQSRFQGRLGNVFTVAESGGDSTTIGAAVGACPIATPPQPCLVFVAPGVYDERVVLREGVTLRGSGSDATTIRWSGGTTGTDASAAVVGSEGSALLDLRVETFATAGNTHAIGVWAPADFRVQHALVDVDGAHAWGAYLPPASGLATQLFDVVVKATSSSGTAVGVYNDRGHLRGDHLRIVVDAVDTATTATGFADASTSEMGASSELANVLVVAGHQGASASILGLDLAASRAPDYVSAQITDGRVGTIGNSTTGLRSAGVVLANGLAVGGIDITAGTVNLRNVTAGAVTITGGELEITNGTLASLTASADALDPTKAVVKGSLILSQVVAGADVRLANNELRAIPTTSGTGTLKCIGNYSQNLTAVSCP